MQCTNIETADQIITITLPWYPPGISYFGPEVVW